MAIHRTSFHLWTKWCWGNNPSLTGGTLEGCIPVTGPVSVDGFELSTIRLNHQLGIECQMGGHPKLLGCLELVFL